MIAKFKNRVDFAGIVNYAHDTRHDQKRARIIGYNEVCIVSNATIADSFETNLRQTDSQGKCHKLSQPVKHISISFSAEDAHRFPDNEAGDRFMEQLVREWLERMGIRNAQFLIARHFDKAHPHCHLVYSRIDLDGNVISDFNELRRNVTVCKEIKQKYGLTFGDSTGKKVKVEQLRPAQREIHEMKTAVLRALDSSRSWAEFHQALEADGIEASFSITRATGQVRGISFAKDGHRHSGSKLSKQKLTYSKLAVKFGPIPTEGVFKSETPTAKGGGKTPTPSLTNHPIRKGVSKTDTPTAEHHSNHKGVTKTDTPSATRPQINLPGREGVSKTVTPSHVADEAFAIQLIPLSLIVELLVGPAIAPTPGGGGTTNDLDWNDERRRRQEAKENQNINKPFKSRRR